MTNCAERAHQPVCGAAVLAAAVAGGSRQCAVRPVGTASGGRLAAALLDAPTVAVRSVGHRQPLVGLAYSTVTIAVALRRRQPSVDVIAWLALVGALLVGEPVAGAVIAVMLFTGGVLEARASARARRELGLLAARAPRIARREGAHGIERDPVEQVVVGDRLLVGAGEIVPVDGRLSDAGVFDESALSGEANPVDRRAGDDVRSGVVNAGSAATMTATRTAAESTYAGVVRLVEQAQADSAPFVRLADRFAIAFVPLTLVVAGLAWAVTGDPVRAVAVLVVATPCPLLLAAPIAIMSGLSRAARHGVIVKGGAALEQLAAGRVLLFDKTGTLTARPAHPDRRRHRRRRWPPTRSCGWRPASTRHPRTCSPRPSSPPPATAA